MTLNQLEIIEPLPGDYNLPDYSEVRKNFKWEDAGTDLSFNSTGKLNIAYETIDRHVDDGYGSKTALHYVNGDERVSLDEAGNVVPRGTVGQLAVKTPWPGLMKEIWGNKDKFDSYFKYEGWYLSGDLAYQDEEDYVFFQSRDDDMINSSGERIGPFEVESKLIEHEAIQEAGVIGKTDKVRGEIVKGFIVLRKGFKETPELLEEIRIFVRNNLAAHLAPKEIEVMAELPKTTISGKILRRELKQMEIEKVSAGNIV